MDSRITHVEIFHYQIPFSYPLTTSRVYTRSGIILFLYDRNGCHGIGEIAPLVGLSKERLNDSLNQLMAILNILKDADVESIELPTGLFPSVKFGLELALLSLRANQKGIPLWKELNRGGTIKRNARVKLSALISQYNKTEQELSNLIKDGYSSFKIKVGNMQDSGLIKALREIGGSKIDIILDANKGFSFEQGVSFAKLVNPFDIRYMEDPINDAYRLEEFFKKTCIDIGIDQDMDNKDVIYGNYVKAWVIKPGIMSGIRESIFLINEALKKNIIPVLSNPFYSGVGVSALVLMASAFIPDNIPMGLDPYRWIKEDILEEPLSIKNGSFLEKDVRDKIKSVNKDLLNKIC